MGTWEELDTEISVENDLSDLDSLKELNDPYNVFEDISEQVDELKEQIKTGSSNGVKTLANFNRSQQQRYLQNCKRPSGRLSSSINDEEQTPFSFIIGTTIEHFYPLCVEKGRNEVHPIPPNTRLRFYGEDGYLIYPKMARAADPVPFVAPAYEDTSEVAEETLIREMGHAGINWED